MRLAALCVSVFVLSNLQLRSEEGWFPFQPGQEDFRPGNAIDLRYLNEKIAGEHGPIRVENGRFVLGNGKPERFWAVNGPPSQVDDAGLPQCARLLAKYGVNLVRIHHGYFDREGEADSRKVAQTVKVVDALKQEGIYSHLSIYFPLWLTPKPGVPWLEGYDGKKHPFAALLFNPKFQEKYREWWTALLNAKTPSGKRLAEEASVAGLEIQNEDSFFFWTFKIEELPEPEARMLETNFADWLKQKYGSLEAALSAWKGLKVKRDAPEEGRISFRPLYSIFSEKTPRDQDTAEFLLQKQTQFYSETVRFLRSLGFKGVITASNWSTASPEVFGPLEKLSYCATDFLDRHGYFGSRNKGPDAAWSIKPEQTYADRSAFRFDAEEQGKPKQFVHPAMDTHYNNKPSMLSEIAWTRPNRYRPEAPIYLAAYGALQGTDGIVHFAFDGLDWKVKPNFWMQPWTLMSPATMGQFPVAAMIYRRGYIKEGPVVASLKLGTNELFQLKGTPLPLEASLDELRLKDLPSDLAEAKPGRRLDPLLHYTGRTEVQFGNGPQRVELKLPKGLIDHEQQIVRSATHELTLDYARGVLRFDAPSVQGASGDLRKAGSIETEQLSISSPLEIGTILLASLDGQPLSASRRMLLQVMSEEKTTGWTTEDLPNGVHKILNIGRDPWLVRDMSGTVRLKRKDAGQLKVTALDQNGYADHPLGTASELKLAANCLYYLIEQ